MTTAFAIVYNGLTVRCGINDMRLQTMTKAQQQLEQDIAVNIGTDLFNALHFFSDYKTRRGTYNRLMKLIKLNRFYLHDCVISAKRKCKMMLETIDRIQEKVPDGALELQTRLRVHYSALCNYVSSI